MNTEYETLNVNILAVTDRALKIRTRRDQTLWIPKSVVEDGEDFTEKDIQNDADIRVKGWFYDRECLE